MVRLLSLLAVLLLAGLVPVGTHAAVMAAGGSVEARRAELVHADEPMTVGVYYYPEQWPRDQWPRDFAAMAKLGFRFVHMAEFSWSQLEPVEGRFDFGWLDTAIDLAGRAGLKVILGTPSAAPPSWLDAHYADAYRIDEHGQRHEHGIRAEVSLSSPAYQRAVTRIVTAMARRYGRDPRVWGWQIDNEPGTFADFSPAARLDFQGWLRERYRTIEAMNAAWGGAFWSSNYASFREVHLPNSTLAAEDKLSPQALLDLARFRADTTARLIDSQAATIRGLSTSAQWITTNYTNVTTTTDPRRSHALDFQTFTLYPVAGANILGGDSYAIGKPNSLMEAAAYFRPATGAFGIMELQPGQVNWGDINPQPMPGAIRTWMWHTFASGASLVSTYRYRHALGGSEMYHEGIVGTDGVTLSRTGREFVDAMHEIQALAPHLDRTAPLPRRLADRYTAYLWSHDVFWDLEIQPQTRLWNSWTYRNGYTLAVKTTGAPLDFIAETDDFSHYPFLIAPAYQMVSPALVAKWRAYAEQGGHLILTCRTGQKDATGHFPEARFGSLIADLIGSDIEGFDVLPESAEANVSGAGATHRWRRWADILSPHAGTEVLATYADHYYAGKAAATTRRVGRGSVTMIGVSTDDGALERTLIREVYRRAGVAIDDLPEGVFLDWRGGYYFLVNYRPEPVRPTLPTGASIVAGELPLAPAGTLIFRE